MSDDHIPAFDRQLHNNYCSTDYCCQNFRITPEVFLPEFIDFLHLNQWSTYAFVTAFNPYSVAQLSFIENQGRHKKLLNSLPKDLTYLPAIATDQAKQWPPESGIFAFDATLPEMIDLAHRFGQNAILWGTRTEKPVVLWTHGRLE
ncbi:MAG: DUF3293 domain-containing protein [Bacteroidota bacterium]